MIFLVLFCVLHSSIIPFLSSPFCITFIAYISSPLWARRAGPPWSIFAIFTKVCHMVSVLKNSSPLDTAVVFITGDSMFTRSDKENIKLDGGDKLKLNGGRTRLGMELGRCIVVQPLINSQSVWRFILWNFSCKDFGVVFPVSNLSYSLLLRFGGIKY